MGLVASQARLLMLTARRHDLSFTIQSLTQQKMMMANSMQNLAMMQSNMMSGAASGNPQQQNYMNMQYRSLEQRKEIINSHEKMLDLMIKNADTQLQAVMQEIESVEKVKDQSIKMGFKYFNAQG